MRNNGLGILGLEEEVEVVPTVEVDTSEASAIANEMLIDALGLENEIESIMTDVTRYEFISSIHQEMEAAADALKVGLEEEMSDTEVAGVIARAQLLAEVAGVDMEEIGLEKSDDTFLETTSKAVSGSAKRIWAYITNFFKTLWVRITGFFDWIMSFFGNVETKWKRVESNMKDAASRWKSALKSATDSDAKDVAKKLMDETVAKVTVIKGIDANGYLVAPITAYDKYATGLVEVFKKQVAAQEKIVDKVSGPLKTLATAKSPEDIDELDVEMTELGSRTLTDDFDNVVSELQRGNNNRILGITAIASKKQLKNTDNETESLTIEFADIFDIALGGDLASRMSKAASAVVKMGKDFKSIQKDQKKVQKDVNKALKDGDKAVKQLEKYPVGGGATTKLVKMQRALTTGPFSAKISAGIMRNSSVIVKSFSQRSSVMTKVISKLNLASAKLESKNKHEELDVAKKD